MMCIPLLAAVTIAASPVSLSYEGPLKGALKEIAQKGGLNVIVASPLDERVEVHLVDVSAEEALETVAKAYHLIIAHEGKMWVVRQADAEAPRPHGSIAPIAPMPPLPPMPAVPPLPPLPAAARDEGTADEELNSVAEKARAAAEKIQAAAEVAQEKAEALREAAQERAEAIRGQKQELLEARAEAHGARQRVGAGGPVRIEKGTHVEQAVAYGGPVIIEEGAVVEDDAVAFGGDVVLEKGAMVKGDAVAFGGSVVRKEGSSVKGDEVSFGGAPFGSAIARHMVKVHKASNSSAPTDEETESNQETDSNENHSPSFGTGFAAFLLQFAMLFGLGFVLTVVAPRRMKALDGVIAREPVKNGIAGFLALLAAVPATALLVLTLVGIPVAVLLWPLIAFLGAVGLVSIAFRIGSALPLGRLRKTHALALAVGVGLVLLVSLIPVLGKIALGTAALVGFGAIVRTRFGQPPRGTPIFDDATADPIPAR